MDSRTSSTISISDDISPSTISSSRRQTTYIFNTTHLFVIASVIFVTSIAFIVGILSRTILLINYGIHPSVNSLTAIHGSRSALVYNSNNNELHLQLPVANQDVVIPPRTTLNQIQVDEESSEDDDSSDDSLDDSSDDEENSELHSPSGQHLLIDIKHVDPNFLNSEQRLASSMIELTNEANVTLLSYHCHSLIPIGVSCIGFILESHVAFHTYPTEGIILLDFFTCGPGQLIPLLPTIKNLFGVPINTDNHDDSIYNEPLMIWSHKLRGYRTYNLENPLEQDLGKYYLRLHSNMDLKIPLVSKETDFQHVDIYEYIFSNDRGSLASYEKSLSNDGSYESLHPELYRPNKVLFLDGVQQSTYFGDAAYHEALVHPAMIAHEHPKRVAIIGGGEGATLREVLKHKSVDEVVMIDIDGELVEMCREYLPEWNDCSDIDASDAESCFDDSRATIRYADAFKYFIDAEWDEQFDVIICDALDPEHAVAIVGDLYTGNNFADSLYNALSDNGVFLVQMGETESLQSPAIENGDSKTSGQLTKALIDAGFESMHDYDEGHSQFGSPWTYLICFKDYKSRANWYRTAPEIDIQLHNRLHKTKSGQPILRYFDAPTMIDYQTPSKAEETVYCRSECGSDYECDEYTGFDHDEHIIPTSHLEARKSSDSGKYGGRGLFAAQDIPQGLTLPVTTAVKSFHVLPSTWSIIEQLHDWANNDTTVEMACLKDELGSIYTFTEGYGYKASVLGTKHFTIDSSITTFCNHGCNGTVNYGEEENIGLTEMTVDLYDPPEEVFNKATVNSPVYARHIRQILSVGGHTLRDIKKGEEIKCNYLSFIGSPKDWTEEVARLRSMCTGEIMGEIFKYEEDN